MPTDTSRDIESLEQLKQRMLDFALDKSEKRSLEANAIEAANIFARLVRLQAELRGVVAPRDRELES